ncbi:ribosome small subunit-dependent GTPase A [Opitutales bacterium ASA1]|uniref:ribosome small subunit-dependent GTPase A n=1 Tax=Congregicoccus parvus TaxID=3081749 RepID=UPI002B28B30B|nr:ribosome small subunit-dependent GTPase A [Opitutales bacterium ASA1]
MSLPSLGWNDAFAAHFSTFSASGLLAARVAVQHKHHYRLLTAVGELDGSCTGRLLHATHDRSLLPVAGDWVAVQPRTSESIADIHAVLPRSTAFVRRAAGPRSEPQVLAANIDTVLLVMALDGNFNLRRLERLLAVTWESGAAPVVVLNKLDLCADPAAARAEVARHAPGAEVLLVSALHETGCDALAPHLAPGRTVAVLGSSGVGKSTLVNRLFGADRQLTGARRDDNSLGRHTTVSRELIPLPCGALILDTPGLREVGMWDVSEGIDETFSDLAALAASCRFSDCTHRGEPGCAVRSALASGDLDAGRLHAWNKLRREQEWLDRRENHQAAAATKRTMKARNMAMRRHTRLFGEP